MENTIRSSTVRQLTASYLRSDKLLYSRVRLFNSSKANNLIKITATLSIVTFTLDPYNILFPRIILVENTIKSGTQANPCKMVVINNNTIFRCSYKSCRCVVRRFVAVVSCRSHCCACIAALMMINVRGHIVRALCGVRRYCAQHNAGYCDRFDALLTMLISTLTII